MHLTFASAAVARGADLAVPDAAVCCAATFLLFTLFSVAFASRCAFFFGFFGRPRFLGTCERMRISPASLNRGLIAPSTSAVSSLSEAKMTDKSSRTDLYYTTITSYLPTTLHTLHNKSTHLLTVEALILSDASWCEPPLQALAAARLL